MIDPDDTTVPHRLLKINEPSDEFWPDYVRNGIIVHVHGTTGVCNVKCFVAPSIEGVGHYVDENDL